MHKRMIRIGSAMAAPALMVAGMAVVLAQAPSGTGAPERSPLNTDEAIKKAADRTRAEAALKNWTVSRTPWGDPDLRGYWLLATYTPLERPAELADKPFYTEGEALAAFKKAVESDSEVDPRTVHYDWKEFGMDAWQAGATPNLRTSLIVDPPDGRLPPWTPEAQQRRAAAAAVARARNPAAGIRTFGNLYTRCVLGLYGAPLIRGGEPGATAASAAAGVSAESQLVQTPGYVVILLQTNSEVRIIPLDGRPPLPNNVRHWLGDSRGRWEGDTLVVETANFNELSHSRNFGGATGALRLVERFTRIGPNTLRYQYTITDPNTWTKPFSAEAPLPRIDPPLYEFACHEQNYGVINVVTGTQISEGSRKAR